MEAVGTIHPEHEIEYHPEHLQPNLAEAGFRIVESLGVCPMFRSWRGKRFDYGDFLCNALSADVESAYLQYYRCVVEGRHAA